MKFVIGLDPGLRRLRLVALTMTAVLASYASALALKHAEHLTLNLVILAVVLALSLSRTDGARSPRERLIGVVLLPVVAVAASEVGTLLLEHETVGDALFVLAVSGSIWLRRFGPTPHRAGTLIVLPFIALLVTPAVPGVGHAHLLWAAVIGAIAYVSVSLTSLVATRTGLITRPAATPPPRGRVRGRPTASTRMAIQMAVALAAAFAVGRALFGVHWSWLVITAFVVGSGNRGRADVLYKGGMRVLGAAVGTIAATALAGAFPRGDVASVVAIFLVLALATWLRPLSYAYWAAGITAVLALLYGYFGQTGAAVLGHRLEGIVLGAVIAIAAAWLVLPVRSSDVLRRRTADVLAALGDLLAAVASAPTEVTAQARRLEHALDALEEIARPHRAHRVLIHRSRPTPHPADVIDAAERLRDPIRALLANPTQFADPAFAGRVGVLRRRVGNTRQLLAGREPRSVIDDDSVVDHPLEGALAALAASLPALARTSQ